MTEESNGSTQSEPDTSKQPQQQESQNATSPSKDSGEKHQRKRMRVPTSCSVCRKRKIKCDKVKPICGSCMKSSVAHLCFYEEPSWISSDELLKHAKNGKNNVQSQDGANSENSSLNVSDLSPAVQSKIESLNDKIKQLEASIAVTELSRSALPAFNSLHTNQNSVSPQPPQQIGQYQPVHSIPQQPQPQQQQQPQQYHQQSLPVPTQYQSTPYSNNYYNRAPQASTPYFAPQPILTPQPIPPTPQPSYQPRSTSICVPPLNESDKYEYYMEEQVDFYDYFPYMIKKRRLEHHGPLSLLSCMKRDVYLKVLWSHVWKTLEHGRLRNAGCDGNSASKEANGEAKNPPKDCELIDQIDPLTTQIITNGKSSALHKELKREKISQKIESLNNSNKSIDEIILDALPSKRIMMILVIRFFKFVYPFLPFLDENSFVYEANSVCPITMEDKKVEKLNIKNKYDYCLIGLLLLVIKFGHMSISDKELEEKPDLKLLKDYKPSTGIITAAKLCLDQYKHWRKPFALRVMQLSLYFRLYFKFCPEDDDVSDGSESQILLGGLFSHAYAIGLHRDPDKLAEMTKTVKRRLHAETWRRVWHKLLELDTTQSIVTGLPLHVIDDRSYDTLLPSEDEHDDEVDCFVARDYKLTELKNELFRQVIAATTNIKKPPTVLDLLHLIKKLENFAQFKIGCLKVILNEESSPNYAKVKKITYIFELTTVMLNLNLKLYEHFEKKNNLDKTFEFAEASFLLSLRIVNTAMNIAFNEELYVGKGFAYYFRPHAANAIFRAFFLLTGFALRLSQAKTLTKRQHGENARYNIYNQFSDIVFFNMENTLQLLSKLSSNHYNYSRMVTACSLLFHVVKCAEFDFDEAGLKAVGDRTGNDNLMHNHLQDLTVDDLPQNNFLMDLVDSKLYQLMERGNAKLVNVLQPAVGKHYSAESKTPATDNKNNDFKVPNNGVFGRGQFYDPVNGFTKRSSVSTESSTVNLSPSAINQENIFNLESSDLNKLLGVPNLDDLNRQTTDRFESDWVSSEEYASLFGIFDEYGSSEVGGI